LGKRGTKKYKEKESAMLYVQRIFVGKMCPNGHIVRKKSEQALFRQYALTNRQGIHTTFSPSLLPSAEFGCPLKKDRQPSYFTNLKKKTLVAWKELIAKTFNAAKMWAVTCTSSWSLYDLGWNVHLKSACFGVAQGVRGFRDHVLGP
jgi:hypothetical protein